MTMVITGKMEMQTEMRRMGMMTKEEICKFPEIEMNWKNVEMPKLAEW
jgi:hypothetical protein